METPKLKSTPTIRKLCDHVITDMHSGRHQCVFIVRDGPDDHLESPTIRKIQGTPMDRFLQNPDTNALLKVQNITKAQNVVFKTYIESKRERARSQRRGGNSREQNTDKSDLCKRLHKQRLRLLVEKVIDRYIINSDKAQMPNPGEAGQCKSQKGEKYRRDGYIPLTQRSNGLNHDSNFTAWTIEGKYNYTPSANYLDETLYGVSLLKSSVAKYTVVEPTLKGNGNMQVSKIHMNNPVRENTEHLQPCWNKWSTVPPSTQQNISNDIRLSVKKIPTRFPDVIKVDGMDKQMDVPDLPTAGMEEFQDQRRKIVVTLPNILLDMDDRENSIMSPELSRFNEPEVQTHQSNETKGQFEAKGQSESKSPRTRKSPTVETRRCSAKVHQEQKSTRSTSELSNCSLDSNQVSTSNGSKGDDVLTAVPQMLPVTENSLPKDISEDSHVSDALESNSALLTTVPNVLLSSKKSNSSPCLIPVHRSNTIPSVPDVRSGKNTLSICGTNVSQNDQSSIKRNTSDGNESGGMSTKLSVTVLNRKRARAYNLRQNKSSLSITMETPENTDAAHVSAREKAAEAGELPQIRPSKSPLLPEMSDQNGTFQRSTKKSLKQKSSEINTEKNRTQSETKWSTHPSKTPSSTMTEDTIAGRKSEPLWKPIDGSKMRTTPKIKGMIIDLTRSTERTKIKRSTTWANSNYARKMLYNSRMQHVNSAWM